MQFRLALFVLLAVTPPLAAELPPVRQVADLRTEPDLSLFRGAEPEEVFELERGALLVVSSHRDGAEIWFLERSTGLTARVFAPCVALGQPSFDGQIGFVGRVGSGALLLANCGRTTLWSTDGTPEGTTALLQGSDFAFRGNLGDGSALLLSEGKLWRTDGNRAGTEPVANLLPEFPREDLELFGALGSRVVFAASDRSRGNEPWISDGTAAGTRSLGDLQPGTDGSTPAGFVALDDRTVLFFARTPAGRALWRTDGTPGGTFALSTGDLVLHSNLFAAGSRAFFFGSRSAGHELITTDGTVRGTTSLPVGGFEYSNGRSLAAAFRGRLYWTDSFNSRQLFTSDGTPQGTLRINLRLGHRQGDIFRQTPFGILTLASQTREEPGVWLLDGVPEPKKLASACRTSPCEAGFFLPRSTGRTGSYVFFETPLSAEGEIQLWSSDGTAPGTRPFVTLPEPGLLADSPSDSQLVVVSRQEPRFRYLWYQTDGTAAGTRVVFDFSSIDALGSSHLSNLTPLGDRLAFIARPEADFYAYTSLGSASGSVRLSEAKVQPSHVERPLTALAEGRAVLQPDDYDGIDDLFVTDGTAAGTVPVTGLGPVPRSSFGYQPWALGPDFLVVQRHTLYRSRLQAGFNLEPLAVLADEQSSFEAPGWVSWNGATYFLHFGGFGDDFETFLWRTDATAPGTVVVDRGSFSSLQRWSGGLVARRGRRELFFSNGFPGGSYYFRGPWPYDIHHVVPTTSGPIFLTSEGQLWRTDGTTEGTWQVAGFVGVGFGPLVALGDRLVFSAQDAAAGQELWVTDGEPQNTRRVADLWPGVAGSQPDHFAVIGDRLYFRANDGRHGWEAWVTDGTAAGTSRLTDLAPGVVSSHPHQFTRFGNEIGFVADDGVIGEELWALPAGVMGEPFEPGPEPVPPGDWLTTAEVPGFRFKVHLGAHDAGFPGQAEPLCLAETLCVSGAVAGRVEVLLRVVGPKPNGFLWPTLIKLTTAQVAIWVEQEATGEVRHYDLAGARTNRDELPALFDRTGFRPSRLGFEGTAASVGDDLPPPPNARWLTSPELPGFRVAVQLAVPGGSIGGRAESRCLEETLCVGGALVGRPEVLVRVVGPRPNGFLWPTLARFTTSAVDVWIEQTRTRARRHYPLEGAAPGRDDLTGLFDREGFLP
ncbi:MAG: hypothetical protein SF066_11320 [Thermoanaerobaculia bacterium]|nr:hypothetical protein [Thermoanaerobaculia bacterium]